MSERQRLHLENLVALMQLREDIGQFPYIRCEKDGLVLLTAQEYHQQVESKLPDWVCPLCGATCKWEGELTRCSW